MSDINKDGGPAFPQPMTTANDGHIFLAYQVAPDSGGMTLRDWFAGMALQGMMASTQEMRVNGIRQERSPELMAFSAYNQADAMLAQRNKP